MSNASKDRKISELLATTTLSNSDIVTVVKDGVNLKMTVGDLNTALGVTGTIQQDGNVSATPVLDIAGSVYSIRNIEDGSGIQSSISAENGITLEHNFTFDAGGVKLITDETAISPVFRSLVAGSGINVSASGDEIQISASGVAASTKTVTVSQLSDFPSPVAGVITLAANTEYLLINDINLGTNRLVMSDFTAVKGSESILITLTYTGTGDMFTGVNTTNRISGLTIVCATGRVVNWSTDSRRIFRMNDLSISTCDRIGLFNSTTGGVVRFTNVSPASVTTNGLEFTGDWDSILYEAGAGTINGGALFDLGTATSDSIIMDIALIELAAGTYLIDGTTASGNINAGGVGVVEKAFTSGAGAATPLNNVSVDDARWNFNNNDDIADTRPDALLSLTTPDTVTITTINTPVKIAGPWNSERSSQMTAATSGTITYNGGKDATLPMEARLSAEPVTGTNKDITFYIAINGSIIANSLASTTVSAGSPKNTSVPWQATLSSTDTVEVWVENNTDTTDIVINNAILRVN